MVVLAAFAGAARAAGDPARLVDPLIGTGGNGHTFPGAAVPFGMVQFSPVTSQREPGGYRYGDRRIRGFALTRLSGAGCTNYGDLPLMPTTAPRSSVSTFDHRYEYAKPGEYDVSLGSGIAVTLTATPRSGLARFVFGAGARTGTVLVNAGGSANEVRTRLHVIGHSRVTGSTVARTFGGDCGTEFPSYTLYFAAVFSRPFGSFGTWHRNSGAFLTFDTAADRRVEVRVGVSFVSVADALLNLRTEQRGRSLEQIGAEARARWNEVLNKIQVDSGTPAQAQVFETALYHAFLHPNVASDVNGKYLGRDGTVRVARGYVRYTNFSGWDVYRTEIPLVALLVPARASDMIESLVADGRESGQLSKWLLATVETGMMVGDPSDAIIADAYAFGARRFEARVALQEMVDGATVPQVGPFHYPSSGPDGYVERPGLDLYAASGYVPFDHGEGMINGTAATTLEYATADSAIAQLAQELGDDTDFATFAQRAESWKSLFNPASGWIEPRRADGGFVPGLRAAAQTGYVEGNAAQYTWMVPHDLGTLLVAMGPRTRVLHKLDRFFAKLNAGPTRPYAWLGNEPSFGAPWAYLWLAAPWRTQAVVRRAVNNLFTADPTGLPGNDDLGALSSWYVWSALGFYPAIPGAAGLAVGSPLFPRATIALPNGRRLRIEAPAASARTPYVRSLRLDGSPYASTWLPLARVAGGGTLTFDLAKDPNRRWATGPGAAPPTLSPTS